MRIGLSVYGTTFGMGLHPSSDRPRITAMRLLDHAVEMGLDGIELPSSIITDEDCPALVRALRERNCFITLDSAGYNSSVLAKDIELAAKLGAQTVRTVVGGASFGGDRRPLSGKWDHFMQEVLIGLREATKIAEREGVNLAIENHQDVASEDLLWLCEEIGSAYFGVNLDAGNPLATAEEPNEFFASIAPFVKNVHLKDYWIYLSEEGYRLVRCPIGQGVIDFPALFTLLSSLRPDVTMAIELGALEARHTRVLADDFWPDYRPRPASQLARLLRFVQGNAKPSGDWRTPYERGEATEAVIAYEDRQLAASLAYIQTVRKAFQ